MTVGVQRFEGGGPGGHREVLVVRGAASFLSSLIGPDSSSPLGMSAIATLHTTPWARLPPMELHVLDTRWSDLSGGDHLAAWRLGTSKQCATPVETPSL